MTFKDIFERVNLVESVPEREFVTHINSLLYELSNMYPEKYVFQQKRKTIEGGTKNEYEHGRITKPIKLTDRLDTNPAFDLCLYFGVLGLTKSEKAMEYRQEFLRLANEAYVKLYRDSAAFKHIKESYNVFDSFDPNYN